MALNPFFLQGSQSEQRLIQDLLNEQMTIYGVEVTYIPRKILNKDNIFTEVEASEFSDNFSIEAYVNTYEGYSGAGDIMTKFGVSLKDELTVTISKERFEDYIGPFMASLPASQIEVATRPQEGDLIYFPLGSRLFEITFVEHEKPFYQLGKNYVYQLQCELFEYEDEVIDTSIAEIDETVEDLGYVMPLTLFGPSAIKTATATATTATGYIRNIILNNDGYDYTEVPTVTITGSPTGDDAKAVAITTSVNNVYSVKEILLTSAGAGYTTIPTVSIVSAITTSISGITTTHGVGAAATATLVTNSVGIRQVGLVTFGTGYTTAPTVTFSAPTGVGTATGKAVVGAGGSLTQIYISDAGYGYTTASVTIAGSGSTAGLGTYQFNEVVTGSNSGTKGRVKNWDLDDLVLKVSDPNGVFFAGEKIVGTDSLASYTIHKVPTEGDNLDKYEQNTFIETEADAIIDFTESNPFGQV